MVMPLYDRNPFKWPTPPYVTWLLIVVNVVVFALQMRNSAAGSDVFEEVAGLVPAALTGEGYRPGALPAPVTLVTYMFLHANFMHIFGNMIFLWVFGDDIEEALGHWSFLVFYIVCGIAGGIVFALSDPTSTLDLIGASGAVSGVIAAYLIFRPCARVTVLVFIVPVRMRAFWLTGAWAALQIIDVVNQSKDGIAYWAHVGGFVAGIVLFIVMRPPGVSLFECVDPDVARPPPLPYRLR